MGITIGHRGIVSECKFRCWSADSRLLVAESVDSALAQNLSFRLSNRRSRESPVLNLET